MVLFPPPFYFVFFYISNLLSYIQNNFSYELARPIMGTIFLVGERAKRARHSQVCSIENRGYIYIYILYVIVINHMRGLYGIYKSRDTRAKPEWQGFMNGVQTERWFITVL